MHVYICLKKRNVSKVTKTKVRTNEGFLKEFSQKTELKPIATEPIEFQMQSMWIRETMLKKYKYATPLVEFNLYKMLLLKKTQLLRQVPQNLKYLYMIKNFKRLVKLWLMTLELQIAYLSPMHPSTVENIYDFINYLKYVSGECLIKNADIYSSIWLKLLKIFLYEINRVAKEVKCSTGDKNLTSFLNIKVQSFLGSTLNKVDYKCLFEMFGLENVDKYTDYENINCDDYETINRNMDVVYRLVIYLAEFAFTVPSTLELNNEYRDIMKKLIVTNTKQVKNGSLKFLSMACRPRNIDKDIRIANKFSNDIACVHHKLIQYLLESGCDANCLIDVHSTKNTFLNEGLFRSESNGLITKFEFDSLIEIFLKHGAHFDYSNDNNLTLAELYHSKFDKSILNLVKVSNFISLKCLSAKRIAECAINYQAAKLPTELVTFIKKHQ